MRNVKTRPLLFPPMAGLWKFQVAIAEHQDR
jgi:hypothetical protein